LEGLGDIQDWYYVTDNAEVISLYWKNERILKASDNGHGYSEIKLSLKSGNYKHKYIHRLVAKAFVKGYRKGLTVDHIDEDKNNNVPENLQWMTQHDNTSKSSSKPVLQLSLDGEIIREWDSTMHAYRVGGFRHDCISKVCIGERSTTGDYVWVYSSDYDEHKDYKTQSRIQRLSTPVLQLTLEGVFIKEWASMSQAERISGFDSGHISKVCKGKANTHKGFKWKYKYKQLK